MFDAGLWVKDAPSWLILLMLLAAGMAVAVVSIFTRWALGRLWWALTNPDDPGRVFLCRVGLFGTAAIAFTAMILAEWVWLACTPGLWLGLWWVWRSGSDAIRLRDGNYSSAQMKRMEKRVAAAGDTVLTRPDEQETDGLCRDCAVVAHDPELFSCEQAQNLLVLQQSVGHA